MERQPEPELMDLAWEAQAYAAADFGQVNQAFVDRLVELASPCQEASALDLGTGPADIPIRLARARPWWHITAIDASDAMLNLARQAVDKEELRESIRLLKADAKATGLPARSFDVVFSNSILHHISDPPGFWREVARLCARGALIFLRDLARPEDLVSAQRILDLHASNDSPVLRTEYSRSLLAAYTVDEVRSQLAQADLGYLTVAMVTDRHLDVFGRTI